MTNKTVTVNGSNPLSVFAHINAGGAISGGGRAYGVPNLRGVAVDELRSDVGVYDYGRLSGDDLAAWSRAWAAGVVGYVVYSYGTPISWYLTGSAEWYAVGQKFSPSTSRHQSFIARVLAAGGVL